MRKFLIALFIFIPIILFGQTTYNTVTVPYSLAMNFYTGNGSTMFSTTLTGNVISSSLNGGSVGVQVVFNICQDATGNRTFAWPPNVQNPPTITSTANACTIAPFINNGGFNWVYTGSGSGVGGLATTVNSLFTAGKILAEYQMQSTETCGALKDYAGINTATGAVGTAPTIISVTGGCNFTQNGAISLPAALNSAQAITLFLSFQSPGNGGQVTNVPVGGNGGGAVTSHCNTLNFFSGVSGALDPVVFGSQISAFAGAAGNGTIIDRTNSTWNGTGVITVSWGTTQGGGADDDKLWINGVQPPYIGTGSALRGNQTVGNYQLGGSSAGSCFGNQSYFLGKIYWALFWATEPSNADEALARNFIVSAMANRGVPVQMGTGSAVNGAGSFANGPIAVIVGDSISSGNGLTQTAWGWAANNCTLSTCWFGIAPTISNTAITGFSIGTNIFPPYKQLLLPYLDGTSYSLFLIWAGTNDACGTTASCQILMDKQNQMCRDWKRNGGTKCVIATMLSRTGADTGKDLYDPIIVNQWPKYFDSLADFAANPNLGADGANASGTYFQVDNVHPNQNSEYNIILPIFLHALNLTAANSSFSTGNTYSSTAPAAVAISAATESGNTMTFTTAANTFVIGQCATVSGVTPAGYNTPANQCWTVLTTPSNTSFTAWNNTTGLGAGTVFGTASVPQEVDADAFYSTLAQNAAGTHTLEPCEVHIGQPKFIRITSTVAWTITPRQSTETINGGATFTTPVASATNNPVVRLDAIRGTAVAAGCTWKASIE